MIRSLRSRHRTMIIGLAIVVPTLFAAGLTVRRPMPVIDAPPPGMSPAASSPPVATQSGNLPDGEVVTVHWFPSDPAAAAPRIEIELSEAASLPEVLVYWTTDADEDLAALPPTSYLIGSLRGDMSGPRELPQQASQAEPGRLVLYVLSRGSVLGVVELHPPKAIFDNGPTREGEP